MDCSATFSEDSEPESFWPTFPHSFYAHLYRDYKKLINSIAEKLRKTEVLSIVYQSDLPMWFSEVGPMHEPGHALRVLSQLEGKQTFSPTNLSELSRIMEDIGRVDLKEQIHAFEDKHKRLQLTNHPVDISDPKSNDESFQRSQAGRRSFDNPRKIFRSPSDKVPGHYMLVEPHQETVQYFELLQQDYHIDHVANYHHQHRYSPHPEPYVAQGYPEPYTAPNPQIYPASNPHIYPPSSHANSTPNLQALNGPQTYSALNGPQTYCAPNPQTYSALNGPQTYCAPNPQTYSAPNLHAAQSSVPNHFYNPYLHPHGNNNFEFQHQRQQSDGILYDVETDGGKTLSTDPNMTLSLQTVIMSSELLVKQIFLLQQSLQKQCHVSPLLYQSLTNAYFSSQQTKSYLSEAIKQSDTHHQSLTSDRHDRSPSPSPYHSRAVHCNYSKSPLPSPVHERSISFGGVNSRKSSDVSQRSVVSNSLPRYYSQPRVNKTLHSASSNDDDNDDYIIIRDASNNSFLDKKNGDYNQDEDQNKKDRRYSDTKVLHITKQQNTVPNGHIDFKSEAATYLVKTQLTASSSSLNRSNKSTRRLTIMPSKSTDDLLDERNKNTACTKTERLSRTWRPWRTRK